MININKSSDKKFYVTVVADNGEILSTSETLNQKTSAYTNIASQVWQLAGSMRKSVEVKDCSLKKPRYMRLTILIPTVGRRTYKIEKLN